MFTPFIQEPPALGNTYLEDSFLSGYLRRVLPREMLAGIEVELNELGELAGGELHQLSLRDRLSEPRLTNWDAWGNRVDLIELTPLWQRVAPLAARYGLVAIPYEQRHGRLSRLHQCAALYLFHPSSDMYTCPLAMTDGATRTLLESKNAALIERAVPRLMSRDPAQAWTSGQWMTESSGGSDVGQSRTRAMRDESGTWRLHGKKWFTSAITSQMALALARPEGNGPGGGNLALFYIETRTPDGRLNGIRVERLKDKLGTRKVPTAELSLDGTVAELVTDTRHGTRHMAPMLEITRLWNSVCAISYMRRGVALALSYARVREAFGAPLIQQPLHLDTLAGLEAETRGATLLTFELAQLVGRKETGELSDTQAALLRTLTPIVKLVTGKQAVAVTSEVLECFGGAGYVEDTGLPVLLRDSQVLPIWEGTTNVLALDALLRSDIGAGIDAMLLRARDCVSTASHSDLAGLGRRAIAAIEHCSTWLAEHSAPEARQAGARRLALTLGRALQLALLVEHAQWQLDHLRDDSGIAAARRFLLPPLDQLADPPLADASASFGTKPASER